MKFALFLTVILAALAYSTSASPIDSTQQELGPVCVCTFEYAPVCGSDGNTYGNGCSLNCEIRKNAQLSLAHTGECTKEIEHGN